MNALLEPAFAVELAMLSALFGVGLYVSWTDLRERRVPNALTYGLIVAGLLGQTAMVWLGVIPAAPAAGTAVAGLVVGLGLTVAGVWGPGDGKLFWGAVVALPPTLYASREWLSLDSGWLALLVNGVLCYLAVLLALPFWREEGGRVSAPTTGTADYLRILGGYGAILGLALGFAMLAMDRPLTYLEGFVAMVLGYRVLEWVVPPGQWKALIVPGVSALAYAGLAVGGSSAYVWLPIAGWSAELAYRRVRAWHQRALVQEVPLASLSVGDILHGPIRDPGDEGSHIAVGAPLKAKEVEEVRKLIRSGGLGGNEAVVVEQALPAAPFVLAGCVVTAVLGGSVVNGVTTLVLWVASGGR